MKLIHLSDLHLGKRVNEFSMLEDQKYILDRILEVIDEQKPKVVMIAGDVYDKSVPSAEAVEVFDEFLVRLSRRGLIVFVISGNHDSPERIAFGGRLMHESGIYMSPVYAGKVEPVTIMDEDGSRVNFYMLPFVKPANVRRFEQGMEEEGPEDAAIEDAEKLSSLLSDGRHSGSEAAAGDAEKASEKKISTYTDAIRTVVEKMDFNTKEVNVLIAHQFVTGASRTESEDVSVGGLDNVDASVFEGFDYVALGHIHRSQECGGEFIRYCGTPLKYSFSEAKDKKSVTVVDIKGKGNLELSFPPLVPLHDMVEIRGSFDAVAQRSFYGNTTYREDYMHIILTDEEMVPDAYAKLRVIYKNLMKLDYDNERTRHFAEIEGARDVEERTPFENFSELFRQQNAREMSTVQAEYMKNLIEEIWGKRNETDKA